MTSQPSAGGARDRLHRTDGPARKCALERYTRDFKPLRLLLERSPHDQGATKPARIPLGPDRDQGEPWLFPNLPIGAYDLRLRRWRNYPFGRNLRTTGSDSSLAARSIPLEVHADDLTQLTLVVAESPIMRLRRMALWAVALAGLTILLWADTNELNADDSVGVELAIWAGVLALAMLRDHAVCRRPYSIQVHGPFEDRHQSSPGDRRG